ncbi:MULTISPECIES: FUSC family protein [Acetobacter]|uniref:FUSC family protein n=1 Tax=Acetobacter thailandicus TaxID=1502842 RepID=A0ABT3QBX5_9PROT|nr:MULTISPECIES: FUSC family protein [Acetobacter]MCX2562792.1 FUSC family protein [Acetobacter thailandicus]
MAPPVIKIFSPPLTARSVWQLICDPAPGRLGYALRMAAGCTASTLAGEIWQVPDLGVTALVTMAIWQKDRVTNIIVAILVNILVGLLLCLIFVMVTFTLDGPVVFVSCISVLSFCFFFLSSASKLKPVAYLLGLITVFGLVVLENIPIGELITRALLYTYLFTLVPGAVLIILGMLICPSPHHFLTLEIAARIRLSIKLLSEHPDKNTLAHATSLLRKGAAPMLKMAKLSGLERMWDKHELACLSQAARCSVTILAIARAESCRAERPALPAELIKTMTQMAEILEKEKCPSCRDVSVTDNEYAAYQSLSELLSVFTQPDTTPAASKPKAKKEKTGFFSADAFTNPEHVRFSLKGTAAVMCSYVLFRSVTWPGIHTCIITCFIVAQPTMGAMISKLTLRIIGATIGGAIGILSIIYLLPHMNGITAFLIMVFVVSLLAAWIKSGDERIAYAGFQIALAFDLSDLSSFGPTSNMTTARDRVIGVLIGNFLTYAMYTSFWPTSAYKSIAGQLDKVTGILKKLQAAPDLKTQTDCLMTLQPAIAEGEISVEFAEAEPANIRAGMTNLHAFKAAFHDADLMSTEIIEGHNPPGISHRIETMESLTP